MSRKDQKSGGTTILLYHKLGVQMENTVVQRQI